MYCLNTDSTIANAVKFWSRATRCYFGRYNINNNSDGFISSESHAKELIDDFQRLVESRRATKCQCYTNAFRTSNHCCNS